MTHPALRTVAALTTGLILMAGTAPALAQTVPPPESAAQAAALQARGETYHRAPDTAQFGTVGVLSQGSAKVERRPQ